MKTPPAYVAHGKGFSRGYETLEKAKAAVGRHTETTGAVYGLVSEEDERIGKLIEWGAEMRCVCHPLDVGTCFGDQCRAVLGIKEEAKA